MKAIRQLGFLLVIVVCFARLTTAGTLTNNAYVHAGNPTVDQDDSEQIIIKSNGDNSNSRLAYMRFDVSGTSVNSDDVVFLDLNLEEIGSTATQLDIWSLDDGVAGETTWDTNLTYNTRPDGTGNLPTADVSPVGNYGYTTTGNIRISVPVSTLQALLTGDSNNELTWILSNNADDINTLTRFSALGNSSGNLEPCLRILSANNVTNLLESGYGGRLNIVSGTPAYNQSVSQAKVGSSGSGPNTKGNMFLMFELPTRPSAGFDAADTSFRLTVAGNDVDSATEFADLWAIGYVPAGDIMNVGSNLSDGGVTDVDDFFSETDTETKTGWNLISSNTLKVADNLVGAYSTNTLSTPPPANSILTDFVNDLFDIHGASAGDYLVLRMNHAAITDYDDWDFYTANAASNQPVLTLTKEASPDSIYSMQITYTNFAGRGTLTNFPALIKLDTSNTDSYTGFLDTTDGYDLRFWTNSALSGTELNYEVEAFDTNGSSYIWVQVPEFTQNTSIWASWGDPAITNQEAYTTNGAVWSEGFEGVWHLGEGGTTDRQDSTANQNHSDTLYSDPDIGTDSVVGNANYFDGDDALEVPDDPSIGDDVRANLTYGMWIRPDSELTTGGTASRSLEKGNSYFFLQGLASGGQNPLVKISGGNQFTGIETALSAGTWYYLTATFDGNAGELAAFLDGERKSAQGSLGAQIDDANLPLRIGSDDSGSWFQGHLDEVRISSVTRSTNWVWAAYMNQGTNHAAFVDYGAVEVPDSVGILWSSESTSDITTNSAWASVTVNTNLTNTVLVWDSTDQSTGSTNDWANRLGLGAQSAGSVTGQISNLSADNSYVWRFYGEDGTTNAWSAATSFASDLTDAHKPVFTNAVGTFSVSGSEVTLGWTDNSDTETSFVLLRSTNGVDFTSVATPSADSVSYTDSVPDTGAYTYRLAATNTANSSGTAPALCETNVTVASPPFGIVKVLSFTDELDAATWVVPFEIPAENAVLVVGVYADGTSFSNFRFGDGGGVGSGDQAANDLIIDDRGALAYFYNPPTGGGLSIRADIPGDGGMAAWVLSGADLNTSATSSSSDTISTPEDNMYVVSWAYNNGTPTLSPSGSSAVDLPIDIASKYAGGGTGTGAGGSFLADTAGSYNVAWDSDGSGSPLSYAFARRPPSLINMSATNITTTSVTFRATLETAAHAVDTLVYWGTSDGGTNAGSWETNAIVGSWSYVDSTNITFSTNGLDTGTQYYYAFRATNADENVWGNPSTTFNTDATVGDVSVVNVAADNIIDSSARLNATLATPGTNATAIAYWWKTGDSLTNSAVAGSWTNIASTNVSYTVTNSLTANTDYSFTFRATNATQDVTADPPLTFTTLGPPVVTNTGATRVGAAKARLNGMVTATNGAALTHVRIYFGTTDPGATTTGWDTNYAFNVSTISEGAGFFTNAVNLSDTQSYYYRVYASNAYGDVWSAVDTFTTEITGTVTIDDTVTFSDAESSSSFTPADFDPLGADKLIATISYEKGFGKDPLTSVSYDGVPMIKAAESVNGIEYTFIYYLDSPSDAGVLSINSGSGVGGYGGSLLALSGTRSGVGPTNSTQNFSATLTTERDNTFVVASYVENGGGSGDSSAQSPLTALFTGNANSADGASGYQYVSNALTEITVTFDGDATKNPATVVAGFEGVDAPAGPTLFRFR